MVHREMWNDASWAGAYPVDRQLSYTKGVMTMHDQNEPPNPFLQLMAYLYDEPDWENPDPHFMDRPSRPLQPTLPTVASNLNSRRPPYLTVVRTALRDDARHE